MPAGWILAVLAIGPVVSGLLAWGVVRLQFQYQRATQEAARDAIQVKADTEAIANVMEMVRTTLAEAAEKHMASMDNLTKVAIATYFTVSTNAEVQLKTNAELARWKANQTHDPGDIREAELAEKRHRSHVVKQHLVDKPSSTDTLQAVRGDSELAMKLKKGEYH